MAAEDDQRMGKGPVRPDVRCQSSEWKTDLGECIYGDLVGLKYAGRNHCVHVYQDVWLLLECLRQGSLERMLKLRGCRCRHAVPSLDVSEVMVVHYRTQSRLY